MAAEVQSRLNKSMLVKWTTSYSTRGYRTGVDETTVDLVAPNQAGMPDGQSGLMQMMQIQMRMLHGLMNNTERSGSDWNQDLGCRFHVYDAPRRSRFESDSEGWKVSPFKCRDGQRSPFEPSPFEPQGGQGNVEQGVVLMPKRGDGVSENAAAAEKQVRECLGDLAEDDDQTNESDGERQGKGKGRWEKTKAVIPSMFSSCYQ